MKIRALTAAKHAFPLILNLLIGLILLLIQSAQAATYTYSNNLGGGVPYSATCSSTLSRTFNVTDNVTVGDVNIGLVLDHPFRNDVSARLISPSGSETILMAYGTGSSNVNYLFDDEASSSFDDWDGTIAPDTGNHNTTSSYHYNARPKIALGTFDGESALGTWTLRICDQGNEFTVGTYLRSQLFIDSTSIVPPANAPTISLSCNSSNLTGSWVGTSNATASTGAYTATITTSANSGASWAAVSAGTMNTINAWSSTAIQGRPSWQSVFYWDTTAELETEAADYDPALGQITFSFNRAVTNPIIHLDRIGGNGSAADGAGTLNRSNSMRFTPVDPAIELIDVASTGHLEITTDYIQRTPYALLSNSATSESNLDGTLGTGAGTFGVLGTHSSITFNTAGVGVEGIGADGIEVVMCIPQADVSLIQTISDNAPTVGDTITITLTVSNATGSDTANSLEVTDLLPTGLTFDSAIPSQGTYNNSTGIWAVGNVTAGSSKTLVITAIVNSSGTIINDAVITKSGVTDIDSLDTVGIAVDDLSDGIADDDETRQTLISTAAIDYSDAPVSYGDATHNLASGIQLGAAIDFDSASLASANADGDGTDDDGVSAFAALSAQDRTYSVDVIVSNQTGNPARLIAWIDFDGNGSFDPDETAMRTVATGITGGTVTLNWSNIPLDSQTGNTFARLRFTTESINNREPAAAMNDGEVEDYLITIAGSGANVSGRVYIDANSNATEDGSESGIGNTVVVLRDTASGVCRSVSTNASGNYSFAGVTDSNYEIYQAHGETTPIPQNCGTGFVRNPVGYQSTTSDLLSFTVLGSDMTDQDFGEVAGANSPVSGNSGTGILFEPDHQSEILPGNVVFYSHTFQSEAEGSVIFSSIASGNTVSGWSHTLYDDDNCNGIIDGFDTVTNGAITIGSTDNKHCIIDKVYSPANVPAQDRYEVKTTATFTFAGGTVAPTTLEVTDLTIAGQTETPTTQVSPETGASRLKLTKTVENLTQSTPETDTLNQTKPGDFLKYRIYYRNTGTGLINDLEVDDTVPPFTGFVTGSNACDVTPSGMTCTPTINIDELNWGFTGSLLGGASGNVSYEVMVDN